MKDQAEIPYWVALAHLPRWGTEKINRLIIKIVSDTKLSLEAFFHLPETDWRTKFELSEKDIYDLKQAKKELVNHSFLAEDLLSQGYDVIPINSPEYSRTLKSNLKAKYSPTILYVKGNKQIMQENSIAIVGSRDASEISLQFTDNVANLASKHYKIVVSGFAKGVDKQALDSALKYTGQGIIVLPQGIMTRFSGFKKYYKPLVEGNVLVLSTFYPNAVWSAGLAMARNPIIYGLAQEIYVAQSNEKGGTWEGVLDGLKKGRTIYVRMPEKNEKNANSSLIEKGAVPVDLNGKPVLPTEIRQEQISKAQFNGEGTDTLGTKERIINALKAKPLTAKQLKDILHLDLTTQKLSKHLKTLEEIEPIAKTKPLQFRIKPEEKQISLSLFRE